MSRDNFGSHNLRAGVLLLASSVGARAASAEHPTVHRTAPAQQRSVRNQGSMVLRLGNGNLTKGIIVAQFLHVAV